MRCIGASIISPAWNSACVIRYSEGAACPKEGRLIRGKLKLINTEGVMKLQYSAHVLELQA
jgi:hypothetical protein